jgi:hypothetical protein
VTKDAKWYKRWRKNAAHTQKWKVENLKHDCQTCEKWEKPLLRWMQTLEVIAVSLGCRS